MRDHVSIGHLIRAAPLMSYARARAAMRAAGLDALLLCEAANIYHATSFWPVRGTLGAAPSEAVLIFAEDVPPALIIPELIHYYVFADMAPSWPVDSFVYASPMVPDISDTSCFMRRRGEILDLEREHDRRPVTERSTARHASSPDMIRALARAIRMYLPPLAHLGVDSAAGLDLLAAANVDASAGSAGAILRRLRLVKTATEIELMRRSSINNRDAVLYAARGARDGATLVEIRCAFAAEAARLGNNFTFMVVDGVTNEFADGSVRDGRGFAIDGVSHLAHYHGDFARTVFLGDPPAALRTATRASAIAWDAVRDALRPGLRFSDIRRIGTEAVRQAGLDVSVAVHPHSVGLWHDDQANNEDVVLEPGMVLSVDCPIFDTEIGGTVHLEDISLITVEGREALHAEDARVLIL